MKLVVNNSALLMDRWQTVELIDGAGSTATLERGCVWITMDGDQRDVVLGPGESFKVERNGKTLIHAEVPSTIRIAAQQPTARVPAVITAGWNRVVAMLDHWAVESIERPRPIPHY